MQRHVVNIFYYPDESAQPGTCSDRRAETVLQYGMLPDGRLVQNKLSRLVGRRKILPLHDRNPDKIQKVLVNRPAVQLQSLAFHLQPHAVNLVIHPHDMVGKRIIRHSRNSRHLGNQYTLTFRQIPVQFEETDIFRIKPQRKMLHIPVLRPDKQRTYNQNNGRDELKTHQAVPQMHPLRRHHEISLQDQRGLKRSHIPGGIQTGEYAQQYGTAPDNRQKSGMFRRIQ